MTEIILDVNKDLDRIYTGLQGWKRAGFYFPELISIKFTTYTRSEFFAPIQEQSDFIALTRQVWKRVLNYGRPLTESREHPMIAPDTTIGLVQDPIYEHQIGEFTLSAKEQLPHSNLPTAFLVVNVKDQTRNIFLRLSILLEHSYGAMMSFDPANSGLLYLTKMFPFQRMTDEEYRIFKYYLEQYLKITT